jgi:hypothetical protein
MKKITICEDIIFEVAAYYGKFVFLEGYNKEALKKFNMGVEKMIAELEPLGAIVCKESPKTKDKKSVQVNATLPFKYITKMVHMCLNNRELFPLEFLETLAELCAEMNSAIVPFFLGGKTIEDDFFDQIMRSYLKLLLFLRECLKEKDLQVAI